MIFIILKKIWVFLITKKKCLFYFSPEGRPFSGSKGRNGKGCPRCGYEVYAAEQMISKNKIWHRRCFTCGDCSRSLDSTNLNDGPDGDIYCRACYGKHFGPKGVGFGL